MKAWRRILASVALLASTQSFAADQASNWKKKLFYRLTAHPLFETTLYKDEALIMELAGKYYAAIAVVGSDSSSLVCAYAAPFETTVGAAPGSYVLEPRYICDSSLHLKPYLGYFEVKYPWCGGEVCANPAIGVGNLDILPEYDFSLEKLPKILPVKIEGRFLGGGFDPSLPVAGIPFQG